MAVKMRACTTNAASSDVPGSFSRRSVCCSPASTPSLKPAGTSVRTRSSEASRSSGDNSVMATPWPARSSSRSRATTPPSLSTTVRLAWASEGLELPPPVTRPKKVAKTSGSRNIHITAPRSARVRRRSWRAIATILRITPPPVPTCVGAATNRRPCTNRRLRSAPRG